MPDETGRLFSYSSYFTKTAPSVLVQMAFFLLIGALAGALSEIVINYHGFISNPLNLVAYGISFGILIISFPALLTVATFKIFKRRLLLRHIMLATLISSASYSIFVVIASLVFSVSKSNALAYVLLILGNASIYGYWILLGKFFIGQRKSAGIVALLQPVLNVLLYIPMDKYVLLTSMPFSVIVIKLVAGMTVFLAVIYLFISMLDRPMKKGAHISGVDFFSLMVAQWLFNFAVEERFIRPSSGKEVSIPVEMLYLKNTRGAYKAAFIKPGIHYGPLANVGGSVATERLGDIVAQRLHATPFIMHGAVTHDLNPISVMEVQKISKQVANTIGVLDRKAFHEARGSISESVDKPCMAIRIRINDTSLIILSKAPYVTEDIDNGVGMYFKKIAERYSANAMIVDAHNSRSESATTDELRGVYKGSKYVEKYKKAIQSSMLHDGNGKILFGASSRKLSKVLVEHKDIGNGYTSVGIFGTAGKKFAMLYFDANNMLPRFREELLKHVMKKFGVECEALTTDTHAVNSITLPASNVLGRHTTLASVIPVLDEMIEEAIANMEPV